MKFKLQEALEEKNLYDGWAQEDIELYESIDWSELPDQDFDAGCAYLDSAWLDTVDGLQQVETEFHKFFKHDPLIQPYYRPIEAHPFQTSFEYSGPITTGDIYRNYKVYNRYDKI